MRNDFGISHLGSNDFGIAVLESYDLGIDYLRNFQQNKIPELNTARTRVQCKKEKRKKRQKSN